MPPSTILLVGGGTGVVGSGIVAELADRYRILSAHRHPDPQESPKVTFVPFDILAGPPTPSQFQGVDAVVNVVWYREPGPDARFARLSEALGAMAEVASKAGVRRFVQLSLPPAPERLETRVPYLRRKREFESRLQKQSFDVTLLQPSAIVAPHDRLIQVMLRLMRRYRHFPMWGDGGYHVSPIHTRDVGWLVGEALEGRLPRVLRVGGPVRYTYRELVDLIGRAAGRPPKLVHVSPSLGRAVVQMMNAVGNHALYTYELDWLLSDMLGLPPHGGRELTRLETVLGLPVPPPASGTPGTGVPGPSAVT